MAVTKGATGSKSKATKAAPKLGDILAKEAEGEKPVAYVSRKGADSAFLIPPGPKYSAAGTQIGWDTGIHLDFGGVGVTKPYFPESNPVHRAEVERIDAMIEENWPIVVDLGLEKLAPDAPKPPFSKWDKTSAAAIKVALAVSFDDDDHDANVELVKAAARYEAANLNREDVLAVLDGLLATEAGQSDAYDVEVSVS